MAASILAEVLLEAKAGIAEGPVWDSDRARLLWTDIPAEIVHRTDPDSGVDEEFSVGGRVGSIALRRCGGCVLATENEFVLTGSDPADEEERLPVRADPDNPLFRLNDGKCDPRGRFLAGQMGLDGRWGTASLFCLEADRTIRSVLDGVTCANGIGWSPDGWTMYYVDTPTYRIDCFDYDLEAGRLSERRMFVDLSGGYGRPDGLCVDAEGCVWIAMWGGGEVRRFSPSGQALETIAVPTSLVSSVAFGGHDLDVLFITSAGDLPKRRAAADPLAGAVFRCLPGTRGVPVASFAG